MSEALIQTIGASCGGRRRRSRRRRRCGRARRRRSSGRWRRPRRRGPDWRRIFREVQLLLGVLQQETLAQVDIALALVAEIGGGHRAARRARDHADIVDRRAPLRMTVDDHLVQPAQHAVAEGGSARAAAGEGDADNRRAVVRRVGNEFGGGPATSATWVLIGPTSAVAQAERTSPTKVKQARLRARRIENPNPSYRRRSCRSRSIWRNRKSISARTPRWTITGPQCDVSATGRFRRELGAADQVAGFMSAMTVGSSSDTVGWIGTMRCMTV